MKIRRRTQITILTDKILAGANGSGQATLFGECSVCCRRVRMFPVDEAAKFASVSPRTIYSLVEAGNLHFQETAEGLLMICFASLQDSI